MSQKANPTLIGVFVVSMVALILIVVLVFGSGDRFEDKFHYITYFDGSVSGLTIGAPVKLKGVAIGSVTDFRAVVDPDGDVYVEVMIETIRGRVRDPSGTLAAIDEEEDDQAAMNLLIERGLRAQLDVASMLTGVLYIRVDFYPDSEIHLRGLRPEMVEVPTIPTSSERMMQNVEKAMENLATVPVGEITEELLEVMQSLNNMIDGMDLGATMVSLDETLVEVRSLLVEIEGQVEPTAEEFRRTADTLGDAVLAAEHLTERLDDMAAESQADVERTMDDLAAISRSLRSLLDYLERNPSSLIWGKN